MIEKQEKGRELIGTDYRRGEEKKKRGTEEW